MIPRQKIEFRISFILTFIRLVLSFKLVNGRYQEEFETKLSQLTSLNHCLTVSSGRAAFYLILRALNLNKNDEIILSSFNTPIVLNIINELSLKPVFVDASEWSYNIDAELIQDRISSKTKVVLVTHIEGYPCNMDKICSIVKEHNLYLIEDCAHSIGSLYQGRMVGTFGIASFFSFGVSKQINTFGGGAALTNSKELYNNLLDLKSELKHESPFCISIHFIKYLIISLLTIKTIYRFLINPLVKLSWQFNHDLLYYLFDDKKKFSKNEVKILSNFQSFIGLCDLNKLNSRLNLKLSMIRVYNSLIDFKYQTSEYKAQSSYFNFPIRIKKRDYVIKELGKRGIDIQKTWMKSLCSLKISKKLANEIIYLPIHHSISIKDVNTISKSLNNFKRFF